MAIGPPANEQIVSGGAAVIPQFQFACGSVTRLVPPPDGRMRRRTFDADPGPALSTLIEYVSVPPGLTGSGETDACTPRSTDVPAAPAVYVNAPGRLG